MGGVTGYSSGAQTEKTVYTPYELPRLNGNNILSFKKEHFPADFEGFLEDFQGVSQMGI